MASPEDWAYLAGIIDGEGYLSIASHISHGKTYVLRATLDVGNTDKRIVDFCHDILDGQSNITISRKNRKLPYYHLQIHSKKLEEPLCKLLPYLIAKKQAAELILRYISLHQPWHGYTEEEVGIANKVRALSRDNGSRARQISLDKVVTHGSFSRRYERKTLSK